LLIPLGPKEFTIKGKMYERIDIKLFNERKHRLECSHFKPIVSANKELPCVIYMHGNCSSRVEALTILRSILPMEITVFCFDFSGSGKSGGDYISLGWYEREDLKTVVDYLRKSGTVSTIGFIFVIHVIMKVFEEEVWEQLQQ